MKSRNINLLMIGILPVMAVFFACTDTHEEQEHKNTGLSGTWELVSIAAEVSAGQDNEKALIAYDLVTTAFPKKGSLVTFYPDGGITILTHENESIEGNYSLKEDSLTIRYKTGGQTSHYIWVAGSTMRLEEDYTPRYKYKGSPYPTVSRVIKIQNFIRKNN